MSAVETRIEKTVNNRRQGVKSITLEMVGATGIDQIPRPQGQKIRNVRQSIADGRAVMTYDEVDETVGDAYTVSGTASQEPLATHPHFQESGKWAVTADEWKLWDKWQKEGTDLEAENLTEYGEGFQKFIKLTLAGFTDYLQPRVSIRVTDANTDEPDLSELGKIAEPASAPTLADGANWLLTGVDASEDADKNWEVTREYMSSGPNGWNADIYGEG
jgi:uncharacterized protein YheU (UPF0270 family)